jgi:anaerobic selenocysteine-containing dehydrogenase
MPIVSRRDVVAARLHVHQDRATRPLLRNARGALEEVRWQTALEAFCSRFKGIQQRHGAASVAFLSTGQIPTEDLALRGALAKFGMGMVHVSLGFLRASALIEGAIRQLNRRGNDSSLA